MALKDLNIVGNGSLGSFTALALLKMARAFGWQLKLFDFDTVEAHNVLNQLYRKEDVGTPKTEALAALLKYLGGADTSILPVPGRVDRNTPLHGVVITLVDTMKARREAFEATKYRADVSLFIDARSGGDGAVVYALDPRDPDQVRRYEETLYKDEEAIPAPCADERTIPTIFAIAAAIARLLALSESKELRNFVEILLNFEQLPILSSKSYKED
ncbi:MAG: ThiF family adenylyltransferase [bacterium]|nr:ThiF family adenylyltransferase [bacterium]